MCDADGNGRTLTDDVLDHFLSILTNGRVTTDGIGGHNDLLSDFPFLAPPHRTATDANPAFNDLSQLALDGPIKRPCCRAMQEEFMSEVQVEQKTYQMPPQDGFTIAHFIVVADIERSARFYETVFGGRVLSRGDSKGAPGYIQIANTWLIVNVGGSPTPDKPTVTLSVPPDPDSVSSFTNIRVADIKACYKLWRSRGAEFITEPKPKYGETRCYIRDPDGYIIEVGQSNQGITYG